MVGEVNLSCGLFSVQWAGAKTFYLRWKYFSIYVGPDEGFFSQNPFSSLTKRTMITMLIALMVLSNIFMHTLASVNILKCSENSWNLLESSKNIIMFTRNNKSNKKENVQHRNLDRKRNPNESWSLIGIRKYSETKRSLCLTCRILHHFVRFGGIVFGSKTAPSLTFTL